MWSARRPIRSGTGKRVTWNARAFLTLAKKRVRAAANEETAMRPKGPSIAELNVPAHIAGRVRHFSLASKTTAKTTTKTV